MSSTDESEAAMAEPSEAMQEKARELYDLLREHRHDGTAVTLLAAALAEALAEARAGAEGKWIAVEERMPESERDVLFVVRGESLSRLGEHDGEIWIDAGNDDFMPGDVTHWMPLPPAPKASRR